MRRPSAQAQAPSTFTLWPALTLNVPSGCIWASVYFFLIGFRCILLWLDIYAVQHSPGSSHSQDHAPEEELRSRRNKRKATDSQVQGTIRRVPRGAGGGLGEKGAKEDRSVVNTRSQKPLRLGNATCRRAPGPAPSRPAFPASGLPHPLSVC